MKTQLEKDETYLKGEWLVKDKKVIGDESCERIKYLTAEVLKEVSVGNWTRLYIDEADGRYWELFYEQGERHGGGPPSLKNISESEAKEKYKF